MYLPRSIEVMLELQFVSFKVLHGDLFYLTNIFTIPDSTIMADNAPASRGGFKQGFGGSNDRGGRGGRGELSLLIEF